MKALLYNKTRSERLKNAGVFAWRVKLYIFYLNLQEFSRRFGQFSLFELLFLKPPDKSISAYFHTSSGLLSFRESKGGL